MTLLNLVKEHVWLYKQLISSDGSLRVCWTSEQLYLTHLRSTVKSQLRHFNRAAEGETGNATSRHAVGSVLSAELTHLL